MQHRKKNFLVIGSNKTYVSGNIYCKDLKLIDDKIISSSRVKKLNFNLVVFSQKVYLLIEIYLQKIEWQENFEFIIMSKSEALPEQEQCECIDDFKEMIQTLYHD